MYNQQANGSYYILTNSRLSCLLNLHIMKKKENIIFNSHVRYWHRAVYENFNTYEETLKNLISEVREKLNENNTKK